MNKLEGYRTIIVAVLALAYSLASGFGIVVQADEQTAITGGIVALLMVVMRVLTKTPVGGAKEPPAETPTQNPPAA